MLRTTAIVCLALAFLNAMGILGRLQVAALLQALQGLPSTRAWLVPHGLIPIPVFVRPIRRPKR